MLHQEFSVGLDIMIDGETARVIEVHDEYIVIDGYDPYWGYRGEPERIEEEDFDIVDQVADPTPAYSVIR